MKVEKFFQEDYSAFSVYSAFRGIGHAIDGQKPSSRKVLCAAKLLKEKTKVASLAARVVDTLEYLHGAVSLEGVISGMAQNFAGTNNVNLLEPRGDFGSVCIQRAGSSRYIYINKEKIFDKIFRPEDEDVLIEQEFEGTRIEPKYYVPIIPMILVNGSEGIGTGFSQKILSRNPLEVISLLSDRLKGKKVSATINPYFKGFKGDIIALGNGAFEVRGKFERATTTTLLVTELPVGYDLEKYNAILTKLEEDKVIVDYTDKSEPKENKFLFEIKVQREFSKKDDEFILDKLKLIKKITENYTCIGCQNEIMEFKSVDEIFDYYFAERLSYYDKRKTARIRAVKEELMIVGSKYFFVKLILDGAITVFKRSKEDICNQIKLRSEFPFYELDGTYDYLLRLPIHSFSTDTIEELKKQISVKKEELKTLTEKSIESLWLDDLKELKEKLK